MHIFTDNSQLHFFKAHIYHTFFSIYFRAICFDQFFFISFHNIFSKHLFCRSVFFLIISVL